MRAGERGRDPSAGCDPLVVCHELQTELVVEDAQISVTAAHNRIRPDGLHLLRHHADIDLVAAVVAEAIESEAIVEVTDHADVVLERDIRASSATAATAAAPTTASAAATTAAEAATAPAAHTHAAASATSSETGVTT